MAVPGVKQGGLTDAEWSRATAGVGGVPFEGQGFAGHYGPIALGPTSSGDSNYRGTGSGCNAGRTAPNLQVDLSLFGRMLRQAAARFAHIPPMFVK